MNFKPWRNESVVVGIRMVSILEAVPLGQEHKGISRAENTLFLVQVPVTGTLIICNASHS